MLRLTEGTLGTAIATYRFFETQILQGYDDHEPGTGEAKGPRCWYGRLSVSCYPRSMLSRGMR